MKFNEFTLTATMVVTIFATINGAGAVWDFANELFRGLI